MNKLKILWKNRNTWVNSFEWWWVCMMSPDDWEKEYKIGWFWMSLNNWYHMFDEEE